MTVPVGTMLTGKPSPASLGSIARGILSEPYPLAQVNTSAAKATQVLSGVLVPVQFGTTVSGVAVCVETAAVGTDPTGVYVAITDLTGVRLAVSGNLKADTGWDAVDVASFAFTTAWTVTADGAVYACLLQDGVWGTTDPKIAGMTAVAGTGKALGSNAPGAVSQAAQATVPATATWVATDLYPWLALV